MEILFYILIFISGLLIGSFLNLVSDRVVREESILFGRSHCENCNTSLKALDLVPLFSFLFLKGKCRYCKTKLSKYYPTLELVTGLIFVGLALFTQILKNYSLLNLINFLFLIFIAGFYIILFLTDAKYRVIPTKVIIWAVVTVVIFLLFNIVYNLGNMYVHMSNDTFGKYLIRAGFWQTQALYLLKGFGLTLLSSFILSGFFLLLIKITKGRGMGGGDVTLAFLVGLVNGFPRNFFAIFMGFLLGAIFSLALIVLRKKTVKDTIAFGPFLILGSIVVYVWGEQLLRFYFGLF